jgi:hypothetical protein
MENTLAHRLTNVEFAMARWHINCRLAEIPPHMPSPIGFGDDFPDWSAAAHLQDHTM